MEDLLEEPIVCESCGARAVAHIVSSGRWWYRVPEGWLVTDTYPPGDDGLQFVCSGACARTLDNR